MTPTDPAAVEAMIERLLAGDLCAVELAPEAAAMLRALVSERDALKALGPDWFAWEADLKRAAVRDRTFGQGFHLVNGDEAATLRDLLNRQHIKEADDAS